MPEAIGSTFVGGSLGGLVVLILYLLLGPGAVVYHSFRWAWNRYSRASRGKATLSPTELETIQKCLPWNSGISLLPLVPTLLEAFGK